MPAFVLRHHTYGVIDEIVVKARRRQFRHLSEDENVKIVRWYQVQDITIVYLLPLFETFERMRGKNGIMGAVARWLLTIFLPDFFHIDTCP